MNGSVISIYEESAGVRFPLLFDLIMKSYSDAALKIIFLIDELCNEYNKS